MFIENLILILFIMKKSILIFLMFLALNSYGQEATSLYLQGYNTGVRLATDCESRPLNRRLYSNTISGNFPQEYKNGVAEGWVANIDHCNGTYAEPSNVRYPPGGVFGWLQALLGGEE
jgi:hypothetical protein